jgi:hypothetical protein
VGTVRDYAPARSYGAVEGHAARLRQHRGRRRHPRQTKRASQDEEEKHSRPTRRWRSRGFDRSAHTKLADLRKDFSDKTILKRSASSPPFGTSISQHISGCLRPTFEEQPAPPGSGAAAARGSRTGAHVPKTKTPVWGDCDYDGS